MPNIIDILARALSLRQETALNSITPNRAGGIMYDTLLVLNQMQLEGGSLLISKVYASVSAMEADTTPTSDLTGRALKPGQLVVIVTSDSSSSDMGSEYRFNGPGSWTYVGKVGGLPLDTVPTQSSTKGITSGGVYTALAAMKAEGYKYMGIATPGSGGTAPGTPNQPVFYIAGPGSYPNFGSITVASGYLGFIKYSSGSWTVESVAVGKDYDAQISALDGQISQLEAKDVELPVSYIVLYGLATSYSGKISSVSYSARISYYVAPTNCKVKITYKRTTDSAYNGRYGIVASVSDFAVGNTLSFLGRFAQDVEGTYIAELSAGQVLFLTNSQNDDSNFLLTERVGTIETIDRLLLKQEQNKPRFDFLFNNEYLETPLSATIVSSDKILQQTGFYSNKTGYNIAVYEVIAGDYIHIRFAKVSPAVWQFQNTADISAVPSTAQGYLIGTPHIDATDAYIEVPKGATHLLVCQLPTNNNYVGHIAQFANPKLDIIGRGTTPISKAITLKEGKRYIAKIDNYFRGDYRAGYVVFQLSCGGTTICEYLGGDLVPNNISFDVPEGETQVTLFARVASGTVCTVSFIEINNPPIFDYTDYGTELIRLKNAAKYMEVGGVPPFVLLHFSDIHADTIRLKRLLGYHKTFSIGIDEIIHTGDSVRDRADDTSFTFWDECGAQNVLNCIGNHDVWFADGFTPSANFAYDTYLKPYIDNENWGAVVQPADAEANGLCYYYKDYVTKGIRLIVLDYRYPTEQISWLSSVLNDAITQGLAVIAAIHYPIELTTNFDTAFDISRYASLGTTTARDFVNAIDSFIANGGEFVCWITGHTHNDFCGVNETSGRRQVAVCIDCAALLNDGVIRYRAAQTKSQDCFNLLAVNVNKKLLTIWRVGEDTDALQRHKGSMCINYVTGELIYTD